jgi:hypothetical protein
MVLVLPALPRASIPAAEADRLIQDLAEYRRLRHLMAHRPCWLEGVWDPEAGAPSDMPRGRTVGFSLSIADKEFVWEIDHDQHLEWGKLLDRCKAGVEGVRARYLLQAPGAAMPDERAEASCDGESS